MATFTLYEMWNWLGGPVCIYHTPYRINVPDWISDADRNEAFTDIAGHFLCSDMIGISDELYFEKAVFFEDDKRVIKNRNAKKTSCYFEFARMSITNFKILGYDFSDCLESKKLYYQKRNATVYEEEMIDCIGFAAFHILEQFKKDKDFEAYKEFLNYFMKEAGRE